MAKKNNSWDSDENAVVSSWVKFNVPLEDKVYGTLIGKRTMKSTIPGAEGKLVNIYEIKVDEGTYHVLDDKKRVVDEPVVLEAGAFVSMGGTAVIDRQMTNVRIGQKFGAKFIEEKPSKTKGFAAAKIVKIFVPKNQEGTAPLLDEEFLEQKKLDDF